MHTAPARSRPQTAPHPQTQAQNSPHQTPEGIPHPQGSQENPERVSVNTQDTGWDTDFIWTLEGRQIHPTSPQAAEISIFDVSHALSMICRYNGHIREFLSVGEHSLLVEELLHQQGHKPLTRLWGLVHDASEFIVGDLIRPIKKLSPEFRKIEEEITPEIFRGLGIPLPTDKDMEPVHQADRAVMLAEKVKLLHSASHHTAVGAPEIRFHHFPPKGSTWPFIQRYHVLMTLNGLEIPPSSLEPLP
jgi:uncharacterized protein